VAVEQANSASTPKHSNICLAVIISYPLGHDIEAKRQNRAYRAKINWG